MMSNLIRSAFLPCSGVSLAAGGGFGGFAAAAAQAKTAANAPAVSTVENDEGKRDAEGNDKVESAGKDAEADGKESNGQKDKPTFGGLGGVVGATGGFAGFAASAQGQVTMRK